MENEHMVQDKRRFIRHAMCFPLTYKVLKKVDLEKIKETTSETINISRDGLLFSAAKSVNPDAVIEVQLPFRDKMFTVKAQVVHCTPVPDSQYYNIGICFKNFNDAFKVKLIEQLYLISEYRDLREIQLGREISLQEASKDWIKRYSKRFQKLYW